MKKTLCRVAEEPQLICYMLIAFETYQPTTKVKKEGKKPKDPLPNQKKENHIRLKFRVRVLFRDASYDI